MNNLEVFKNEKYGQVRTLTEDGKTLFCGVDIATSLGYVKPNNAIATHCRYSLKRGVPHPQNPEKTLEMTFIPEGDVYRLIASSKLPKAEDFERWIFDEVLPSIRKNGGYIMGQNTMSETELIAKALQISQRILAERETRIASLEQDNAALQVVVEQQKQEIADFQPIKRYVDTILSSDGTMVTTQIAADYGLSAQKLNKILHEERIQWKVNGQWVLYQEYAGKGYTQSCTVPITRKNGNPDSKVHTRWTQAGRLMIHNILTGRGIQPKMDTQPA